LGDDIASVVGQAAVHKRRVWPFFEHEDLCWFVEAAQEAPPATPPTINTLFRFNDSVLLETQFADRYVRGTFGGCCAEVPYTQALHGTDINDDNCKNPWPVDECSRSSKQ